jgi:hypothetical protein
MVYKEGSGLFSKYKVGHVVRADQKIAEKIYHKTDLYTPVLTEHKTSIPAFLFGDIGNDTVYI